MESFQSVIVQSDSRHSQTRNDICQALLLQPLQLTSHQRTLLFVYMIPFHYIFQYSERSLCRNPYTVMSERSLCRNRCVSLTHVA